MKEDTWQATQGISRTWVVSLLFCFLALGVCDEGREACERAQQQCVSRVGCGMALHSYFINCRSLFSGDTDVCTLDCRIAIISLLSTEDQEGANFMECDCSGKSFCLNHKRRVEICSRDVMNAMESVHDEHTDISCSLAELICRADTSCYTALRYYERHCTKLFKGEKCSARCNNSLTILYRQAKARKLRTCICDGSEEYPCEAIQRNTERLCFASDPPWRRRHRHRHRHRGNETDGGTVRHSNNAIARQQENKDRVEAYSSSITVHHLDKQSRSVCFVFMIYVLLLDMMLLS